MSATIEAPPSPNSATNNDTAGRQKAWKAEIHTPEAEYNANVPLDAIERDPANRVPTKEDIAERAASIEAVGLLQPIVLRDLGGGKYQIMGGETRWRAFQLLKRKTIPARIYKGQSDTEAVKKAIAENAQRADLKPIERAKRFKQLADLGTSQKEIGQLAGGLSQPVVANSIRLLELPEEVQAMVDGGELTEAHGVILVKWAKWPRVCACLARWAKQYPAKNLTHRQLPHADELVRAKLVVSINTGSHWSGPLYKIPDTLKKVPEFIVDDYTSYYILPDDPKANLWEPEMKRQDDARAAAEKAEKAKEAKASAKTGGMTKEQRERVAKVRENKASRAKVKAAMAAAIERLKTGAKGVDVCALQIVVEAALDDYRHANKVDEAMALLGCVEPAGKAKLKDLPELDHASLYALGETQLVRIAALAVLMRHAAEAERFASDVPEEIEHISGGKLVGPQTEIEGLTPSIRKSIEHELGFPGGTPNRIGEMFGVPPDWVRSVKRDMELRELAGAERPAAIEAAKAAAPVQAQLALEAAPKTKAKPKVKAKKGGK